MPVAVSQKDLGEHYFTIWLVVQDSRFTERRGWRRSAVFSERSMTYLVHVVGSIADSGKGMELFVLSWCPLRGRPSDGESERVKTR